MHNVLQFAVNVCLEPVISVLLCDYARKIPDVTAIFKYIVLITHVGIIRGITFNIRGEKFCNMIIKIYLSDMLSLR